MLQFEEHIAQYLESQGVGIVGGTDEWGIYVSLVNDKPDAIIVIREVGGTPIRNFKTVIGNFFQFNIMIRSYAGDYSGANAKANEIYDLLKLNESITVGTDIYNNIKALTNIMDGGQDKKNRPCLSINFEGLYSN